MIKRYIIQWCYWCLQQLEGGLFESQEGDGGSVTVQFWCEVFYIERFKYEQIKRVSSFMENFEISTAKGVICLFRVITDRGGKGCRDRSSGSGRETSVFGDTQRQISLRLTDIPHLTLRTIKLINNIGNKVRRKRFFMFEHSANGFRVGKDESKDSVWIALFQ